MIERHDPEALLRGVAFFRGLDRVNVARLVGALEPIEVGAGDVIVREGSAADGLYLLDDGELVVTARAADGAIVDVDHLSAPSPAGELGLLLPRWRTSIRALTPAALWRLPRERFERVVRDRPEIGLAVSASLAERADRRSARTVSDDVPAAAPARSAAAAQPRWAGQRRIGGAVLAVGIPLLLWNAAPPAGLDVRGWHTLVVLLGAAIGWLTEPLSDVGVALALAAAWGIAGVAALSEVLAGFATPTWVISLSALTVAAGMTSSGLLFRASLFLLRSFPATYRGQVLALFASGLALSAIIPASVGRVAAVAPLTAELAAALGQPPRSRGSAGIAFAGLVGHGYFASIFLTGLALNFFVVELLSAADRERFAWLGWLQAASVAGVTSLVLSLAAVAVLFPPAPGRGIGHEALRRQLRVMAGLSRSERVALLAVGLLVAGFVAQPVIRVDPAWVAVAAAIVAMAGAIDRDRFRTAVDWPLLVLLGTMLGTASVLEDTGVVRWLSESVVGPHAGAVDPALFVVALALGTMVLRTVVPTWPMMMLGAVVAMPLAPAFGTAPWVAGFVVLLAANVWVLPYQGVEYQVMRSGTRGECFTERDGIVLGSILTSIRLAAILASIPFWRALGLVG